MKFASLFFSAAVMAATVRAAGNEDADTEDDEVFPLYEPRLLSSNASNTSDSNTTTTVAPTTTTPAPTTTTVAAGNTTTPAPTTTVAAGNTTTVAPTTTAGPTTTAAPMKSNTTETAVVAKTFSPNATVTEVEVTFGSTFKGISADLPDAAAKTAFEAAFGIAEGLVMCANKDIWGLFGTEAACVPYVVTDDKICNVAEATNRFCMTAAATASARRALAQRSLASHGGATTYDLTTASTMNIKSDDKASLTTATTKATTAHKAVTSDASFKTTMATKVQEVVNNPAAAVAKSGVPAAAASTGMSTAVTSAMAAVATKNANLTTAIEAATVTVKEAASVEKAAAATTTTTGATSSAYGITGLVAVMIAGMTSLVM